ncbi:MAG: type VI secretion system ATPase TssH [Deltaproteobacteria bacterium]|jgi:type VI secretion system protein VasG|nr:type VI secretion system ATPase TssH [Deltaproteobacteria bacterium]
MISADIKSLIGKLNSVTTQILIEAGGLAVGRTNYELAVEHFLIKAMETSNTDVSIIIDSFKVDRVALRKSLNKSLENLNTGNSGRPAFSDLLGNLLEAAWLTTSVDLNLPLIRSGTILLAYLKRPLSYAPGVALPELKLINKDDLTQNFFKILSSSPESGPEPGASEDQISEATAAGSGDSFVAKYCENFTAKAARGEIDPVFGRDHEIRSMVNILARRRKNNPIVVGEPGVGKTAVIEGLAKRIHEGDVPNSLKGVTLLALDIGLLEAGASMKGEFERRLKGVIDEIKSSPKPIILFIDEAHTLIGAGGAAGGSDAANLLKPALARGELKTCAATTWKEYKKYFEKDAALARRFQLVTVGEPSADTCLVILRGLKEYYETSHGVLIRDEALKAAAIMSDRYISGRFLPDKAVDLVDTACARVKVGLAAKPIVLEDKERSLAALERERDGLARDEATGPVDEARVATLVEEIAALNETIDNYRSIWNSQRDAASAVIAARDEYLKLKEIAAKAAETPAVPVETAPAPEPPKEGEASPEGAAESGEPAVPALSPQEKVEAAAKALEEAQEKWRTLGHNQPDEMKDLIDIDVTSDAVAKVVSDWTGIPLGRLAAEEAQLVNDLSQRLTERIKGQDEAVAAIVKVVQAAKAGLKDPAQPLGVFLMVGPSGVGKTETGLVLAELLFGDEKNITSINMSEFQERHTVSRLVGSPPGYVGYGEGGLLTEAVRQKPYSVVLLDECEKAHIDVMNIFYQVFDKGVLTDAEGKTVNFANTIILLTSNLGSDIIEKLTQADPPADLGGISEAIRPVLTSHFQPALLARMSLVPYKSLNREAMEKITTLKLNALAKRVLSNNGAQLVYADDLVQGIADRCLDVQTGARNIDHILNAKVTPKMAQEILKRLSSGQAMPKTITLGFDESQEFKIDLSDE